MVKDTTIIDLNKLQSVLKSLVVDGKSLTDTQKSNIVWGPFGSLLLNDTAIILGNNAIPVITQTKFDIKAFHKRKGNFIGQIYEYYNNHPNKTDLFLFNDNVGLIEFPNSVEGIPTDTTIAVGGIYTEDDLEDVAKHLSI